MKSFLLRLFHTYRMDGMGMGIGLDFTPLKLKRLPHGSRPIFNLQLAPYST
jgi:hypothetical protein